MEQFITLPEQDLKHTIRDMHIITTNPDVLLARVTVYVDEPGYGTVPKNKTIDLVHLFANCADITPEHVLGFKTVLKAISSTTLDIPFSDTNFPV